MIEILTALVLSLPLIAAYGMFAIGIVMIYRASRVLNLAHGAMAMLPAYLLYELSRLGIPILMGLPLALVCGGGLGWLVERVFVRRLRAESLTAQTVGTVAALGILVALAAKIWGTTSLDAVGVFPQGHFNISRSIIRYGELGLFVVMVIAAVAIVLLLVKTDVGLMMRGSAESRLAASLMGVNPDRMISLTWVIGGSLAGLAGVLLAAVTNLHPYRLSLSALPAFIAALIGGLGSLPGALVGAAIVGGMQGLVPIMGGFGDIQGAPELLLALVAIGAMMARGRAIVGVES